MPRVGPGDSIHTLLFEVTECSQQEKDLIRFLLRKKKNLHTQIWAKRFGSICKLKQAEWISMNTLYFYHNFISLKQWFILSSHLDAHVTCAFSGQCTLPCSIDPHSGNEAVIHWYHDNNKESPVHSYYLGENHLGFQDPKYKGRTFLSLSEIPFGQASLLIKDVRISDEGKYKCYTSTTKGNKETFVNVKVYGMSLACTNTVINTDISMIKCKILA